MNLDTETKQVIAVLMAYAQDLPNMHTPDISENHTAELITALFIAVGFIDEPKRGWA